MSQNADCTMQQSKLLLKIGFFSQLLSLVALLIAIVGLSFFYFSTGDNFLITTSIYALYGFVAVALLAYFADSVLSLIKRNFKSGFFKTVIVLATPILAIFFWKTSKIFYIIIFATLYFILLVCGYYGVYKGEQYEREEYANDIVQKQTKTATQLMLELSIPMLVSVVGIFYFVSLMLYFSFNSVSSNLLKSELYAVMIFAIAFCLILLIADVITKFALRHKNAGKLKLLAVILTVVFAFFVLGDFDSYWFIGWNLVFGLLLMLTAYEAICDIKNFKSKKTQ